MFQAQVLIKNHQNSVFMEMLNTTKQLVVKKLDFSLENDRDFINKSTLVKDLVFAKY